MLDDEGRFIKNPEFSIHGQQDKLLASWLLSTVSDEVLIYITGAHTSIDVWQTIERRFAAKSGDKIPSLRHALYSQNKEQLNVKEYLFKIKNMCDSLIAAGNMVSDQEQVSIILAGLPVEYEAVRVVASTTQVSLDLLTEMLLDCEARQLDFVFEVPVQADMVNQQKGVTDTQPKGDYTRTYNLGFRQNFRRGRGFHHGRGRGGRFSSSRL